MNYRYVNPVVPAELNFTEVEGPDGMVSHAEIERVFNERYTPVGAETFDIRVGESDHEVYHATLPVDDE